MRELFDGKLNSDFMKAYTMGREAVVFVENEADVPFWHGVLRKLAPKRKFRIIPSVKGNLVRGKSQIMKMRNKAGEFMILCVDSDLDYLLPESGDVAVAINSNPYIFQTYTYAVENYKCYAPNLSDLCVLASLNNERVFDFVEFMAEFSRIVYDMFVFAVYLKSSKDHANLSLRRFMRVLHVDKRMNLGSNGFNILEHIRTKVDTLLLELKNKYPDVDLESIRKELRKKGLSPENTYLFLRGHDLYDRVALPLVNRVVTELREQKFREFERQSKTREQLVQKMKEYNNMVADIRVLLNINSSYDSCFLFKKIRNDINFYLDLTKTK